MCSAYHSSGPIHLQAVPHAPKRDKHQWTRSPALSLLARSGGAPTPPALAAQRWLSAPPTPAVALPARGTKGRSAGKLRQCRLTIPTHDTACPVGRRDTRSIAYLQPCEVVSGRAPCLQLPLPHRQPELCRRCQARGNALLALRQLSALRRQLPQPLVKCSRCVEVLGGCSRRLLRLKLHHAYRCAKDTVGGRQAKEQRTAESQWTSL